MATCAVTLNQCLCKVTVNPRLMMRLTLLCQIYTSLTMAACDVPTLLSRAACFAKVTVDTAEMLELQLLCEISSALGGGGGSVPGGGTSGSGAPSGAPTGNQGWYYRTDTNQFYVWNSVTSNWDLLLG